MRSVSYNMGVALLARAIVSGIGFFIVGILTRTLGPDGFGDYSAVFAYLYMFGVAADMGLYTVVVREISREGADEQGIASRIFTLRFLLAVGIVATGVAIAFMLPYARSVQIGIAVAALSTVFSSLVQVLMGIFQKQLKLYLVSIADVIMRAVQITIIVFLVATGHSSLQLLIATSTIAETVHFGFVWWFARRLTPIKFSIDTAYWKQTIQTALPIAASLVFVLLYFKFDTVQLSLMKPSYDVGVYSVAYKVLELIIFIPAMYLGLIMPMLSRYAMAHREKFRMTYQKAFDVISILAAPALVYCFVLSGGIIRLISGTEFPESVAALRILSGAIFLIFYGNLGGNALVALNLQRLGMWIYCGGAVFNVVVNFILIPRYSYFATSWTTVITELCITAAMFLVIYKKTAIAPRIAVLWKTLFAAAVMGIIIWLLSAHFFVATAAALAYFIILYLIGGITRSDIRALMRYEN